MKIKNCKVGQRVEAKVGIECVLAGAKGTIIQDSNNQPYVNWDDYAVDMYSHDGYSNVWAVRLPLLRRIKE